MKSSTIFKSVLILFFTVSVLFSQQSITRPPAVPLVACDPFFSLWSVTDHPADSHTRHWTGTNMGLCIMARIDGHTYRLVSRNLEHLPKLSLKSTTVNPTQTIYDFQDAGVALKLIFTTPLLPESLDLVSRPASYISWQVKSADNKEHEVSLYIDHSAELCLNNAGQEVAWGRLNLKNTDVLKMGSVKQPVLESKGDDHRIDWGYIYLVSPKSQNALSSIASADETRKCFIEKNVLPESDDFRMPRAGYDNWPVSSYLIDLGKVGEKVKEAFVVLAYDDIYSIEYFQRKIPGYWTKEGMNFSELLIKSVEEYKTLTDKCAAFDKDLLSKLTDKGGNDYASVCALAYRQVFAAHKLTVDVDGDALLFSKENFSNGCIATVDVIYPAAPFFMYLSNDLLKASLRPVLEYSEMARWKFPFAPHDLGQYPMANGQVYGGGELNESDQMPVEESGNMIILTYAACRKDGNAQFAVKYWNILEKWAKYLKEKGLDPENQLCTDDFTGHLAHNTNLSIKAIVALGCFSKICDLAGKKDLAKEYYSVAKDFAKKWEVMARDNDHYRLAFDKPGSWSMKYNLVWDKLFKLGLFAPEIAVRELNYYKTKLNKYGLPLDNRADFTKPEWMTWVATMADSKEEFEPYMHAIAEYLNATPDRVPFNDWFETKTARKSGFQARSPIGGIFIKMLDEK